MRKMYKLIEGHAKWMGQFTEVEGDYSIEDAKVTVFGDSLEETLTRLLHAVKDHEKDY